MEATKGIGQKYRKQTKRILVFDSLLSSKKVVESVMEVSDKLVGMVKTNTKGLLKDTIEKLTNYWLGVSYPVLRRNPMLPGVKPLISID